MHPRRLAGLRLALTVTGLLIAGYLTLLHYDRGVPLVCGGGPLVNCEAVLSSPSSMVLDLPVAAWGLLWFAVALGLALLSWRARWGAEPRGLRAAGLAWTLAGVVGVLWLVYEEIGVIGRICAWCTGVHAVVLALLVVQVVDWQSVQPSAPHP